MYEWLVKVKRKKKTTKKQRHYISDGTCPSAAARSMLSSLTGRWREDLLPRMQRIADRSIANDRRQRIQPMTREYCLSCFRDNSSALSSRARALWRSAVLQTNAQPLCHPAETYMTYLILSTVWQALKHTREDRLNKANMRSSETPEQLL